MFTFVYLYEWMTIFKYSRFFKNVGFPVSNNNVFYPHSLNLYFGKKWICCFSCLTHVKWPSADRCMNNVKKWLYLSSCQESGTNICMVFLNLNTPFNISVQAWCPLFKPDVHLIWSLRLSKLFQAHIHY